MNYAEISKKTISSLYQSYNSLKRSPLDADIRLLTELRTSQINGCTYCCEVHSKEALSAGIAQEKLKVLGNWEASNLFTPKEKLALQWTEDLTRLTKKRHATKTRLLETFSEREVVDLTACISLMNALNRIAIALKD